MKPITTIQDVEAEIVRAILVLRMLPREGPQKVTSFWPNYLKNEENSEERDKVFDYFKPLPSEIDDMDIVLEEWLKVLDYDERLLVFKRNAGWNWKELVFKYNMSRSALFERYKKCLQKILDYALAHQAPEEN